MSGKVRKIVIFGVLGVVLLIVGFIAVKTFFISPNVASTGSTGKQEAEVSPFVGENIAILAEDLDTPWAIAHLPTGGMLVTERPGRVRLIDANGTLQEEPVATLTKVKEIGEGGLLGIALHPDFATNNFVYLYYTYSSNGSNTLNRVVRMTLKDNKLGGEQILIDKIPGASNHNGGRIRFGPDGNLYIGTGDAEEPSEAQNTKSLAGKILRVTDQGKAVTGNPFNNQVYSYGHRNVQGLAFDASGQLWATEHGRSGAASGLDEINRIESGKNYGWPDIEGTEARSGMVSPAANSGPTKTWAPAGAEFIGNSLFFGGLKGQSLFEALIDDNKVSEVKEHLSGNYGRIREVIKGLDGMLYITTSNNDSRGTPRSGDDKVIRINPEAL